jgi:hypothetical protein
VKKAKIRDNAETDISLEKIRQTGICRHYERLKDQGLSPKECLKKTAVFARISEKQASGILTDKKQPTGKKTSSFSKYLEEIEMTAIALKRSGNCKERRNYEEIRRAVEKDAKLNDEEKSALASELDSRSQEAKELSCAKNIPTPKPQFKSLVDAIKNFGSITKKKAAVCPDLTIHCDNIFSKK